MTEKELRTHIKNNEFIEWDVISRTVKLSEDFIREYADKVWWFYISKYQTLSEELIKDQLVNLDKYVLSRYQKLSNEFILEYFDILHPNMLLENGKLKLSPQIKAMCQLKIL
jgi:hypothetical protein